MKHLKAFESFIKDDNKPNTSLSIEELKRKKMMKLSGATGGEVEDKQDQESDVLPEEERGGYWIDEFGQIHLEEK